MVVVRKDAPNAIYYGDPLRPGTFEKTQKDEFGLASDGSETVSVVDMDNQASTPPDIIFSNENTFDKMLIGLTESEESLASVTGGTGPLAKKYKEINLPDTDSTALEFKESTKGIGETTESTVVVLSGPAGSKLLELTAAERQQLKDGTKTLVSGDYVELDTGVTEEAISTKIVDVTGDGVKDIVQYISNDVGGVAVHIYAGAVGTELIDDALVETKVGNAAIEGNEMTVSEDGNTISIIDKHGGVHVFKQTGSVWSTTPQYPDPNLPVGSTTAPTEPHNHQDDTDNLFADFDGDG